MSTPFVEPYEFFCHVAGVLDWAEICRSVLQVSHIWVVGLIIGIIFPRQPLLSNLRGFVCSAVGLAVGLGAHAPALSTFMMLINGAIFIQSWWYKWTAPGTFHRVCASVYAAITGTKHPQTMLKRRDPHTEPASTGSDWFITETDLNFFQSRVERQDAPVHASVWEPMLEKQIQDVIVYKAYRRMLKDKKKSEYLSTSVTCDTSPQEVMDFYLADPVRQQWDGLLTTAETILTGDFQKRQQLVHWIRSFPFAFLSDRDYIIARQSFEVENVLYGITKVVPYHGHNPGNTVVMDAYWSMWSCKSVECPFGTGKRATETTLLHMEDFKIPENLARFAVKAGMWGFVKKMTPYMRNFADERRARGIQPDEKDPKAFGSIPQSERRMNVEPMSTKRKPKWGKLLLSFAVTTVIVTFVRKSRGGNSKQKEQHRL